MSLSNPGNASLCLDKPSTDWMGGFCRRQQSQKLLWIIDSAPIFLGLTLSVAGKREDSLIQIKTHLEQTVTERISELQGLNQDLKAEIEGRRLDALKLKVCC